MKILGILIIVIIVGFITKTVYANYTKVSSGVEAVYGDNGIYGCVQRKIEADRMPRSTPQEREKINEFMNGCEKLSN